MQTMLPAKMQYKPRQSRDNAAAKHRANQWGKALEATKSAMHHFRAASGMHEIGCSCIGAATAGPEGPTVCQPLRIGNSGDREHKRGAAELTRSFHGRRPQDSRCSPRSIALVPRCPLLGEGRHGY